MTLTQPRTLRERPPYVKRRKRLLRKAGYSYTAFAKAADVTASMAWKWMNGDRVSSGCSEAFARLTGVRA